MKFYRFTIVFLSATLGLNAAAEITVDIGDYQLLPDTPNQIIEINVSTDTGDTIAVMNFLAEIRGAVGSPLLSGVDFDSETGLLFFGNSDGYSPSFSNGIIEQGSITIAPQGPEILAQGKIRVFFDTTGILSEGVWQLSLTGIAGNPQNNTTFGDMNASTVEAKFNNGSLIVIPEPNTAFVVILCALACYRRCYRISTHGLG
ncbi:MAG: hypothetical protein AAGA25_11120 [Planctomycetota bacterium]